MTRLVLLLSVLTLTIVLPASAQREARFHLGGAASSIVGDDDTDFTAVAHFFAGGGVAVEVARNLAVRAEINYVVRGASVSDTFVEEFGVNVDATFNITYFEIPILAEYRLNRSNGVRPAVFAGPAISRKLDGRVEYSASEGGPSFSNKDDSIQNFDVGAVAGAEITLPIRGDRLLFGARAYAGLANTRNASPATHNRSAMIYLGIVF